MKLSKLDKIVLTCSLPVPKRIKGVYFLSLCESVVYVGKSAHVLSRILQHQKAGIEFDSIRYIAIEDASTRTKVESHWIKKLQPKYNTLLTSRFTGGKTSHTKYAAKKAVANASLGCEEIMSLDIPLQSKVALVSAGIKTKQQLFSISEIDLLSIQYFGRSAFTKVRNLRQHSTPVEPTA